MLSYFSNVVYGAPHNQVRRVPEDYNSLQKEINRLEKGDYRNKQQKLVS